jgi:hypothetical protein
MQRFSYNLGSNNGMWKGNKATPTSARARARRYFGKIPGKEIHHKDGNPFNNDPKNIEYHTRREHMKLDGRLDSKGPNGKFVKRGNFGGESN